MVEDAGGDAPEGSVGGVPEVDGPEGAFPGGVVEGGEAECGGGEELGPAFAGVEDEADVVDAGRGGAEPGEGEGEEVGDFVRGGVRLVPRGDEGGEDVDEPAARREEGPCVADVGDAGGGDAEFLVGLPQGGVEGGGVVRVEEASGEADLPFLRDAVRPDLEADVPA